MSARTSFVLCAIIGGLILVYFNFFTNESQVGEIGSLRLTPIVIMSLLIIIYAYFARNIKDASRKQVADGCYYLGFIFTLMSIGVTLVQLGLNPNADVIQNSILANFGIALVTTLVGLICRIYLGHFIPTVEASSTDFADSIEQSAKALTSFKDTLEIENVRIERSISALALNLTKIPSEITESTESFFRSYGETLNDSMKNYILAIDQHTEKLTSNSEQWAGMSESLAERFSSTYSSIEESLSSPLETEKLRSSLNSVTENVSSLNTQLERMKIESSNLGALDKGLGESLSNFETLSISLSKFATRLSTASNEISTLKISAENFNSSVEDFKAPEVLSDMNTWATDIQTSISTLSSNLGTLSNASEQTFTNLDTINSKLRNWETILDSLQNKPELELVKAHTEKCLEDIRSLQRQITSERDSAVTATDELYRDLTQLAKKMIRAIS